MEHDYDRHEEHAGHMDGLDARDEDDAPMNEATNHPDFPHVMFCTICESAPCVCDEREEDAPMPEPTTKHDLRQQRDAIHEILSQLSYEASDAEANERDALHHHVAKAFYYANHGRPDAAAAHMGSAQGILRAITSGIFAAAILALLPLTSHAQAPDPRIAQAVTQQAQPAPLAEGCVITGATSEGFPVATCADGSHLYADMDGAGGYDSGLPVIEPGTWRPIG